MGSSFEKIFDKIRTRWRDKVVDSVTDPIELPTGYDNDRAFIQPEEGTWARVTIQIVDSDIREIGNAQRHRHTGVIFAQLFDDLGRGDDTLTRIIDTLIPSFRSLEKDNITYRTPSIRRIGQSGKWYQINVLIPFHFDDVTLWEIPV